MGARTAPAGLGTKARRMWRDIATTYDLRVDEYRVLEEACREADLIDRLEAELQGEDFELLVRGSMGQPVANPIIQELRQHRSVLARLLAGLKLPDEPAAGEQSAQARSAALTRWQRGATA